MCVYSNWCLHKLYSNIFWIPMYNHGYIRYQLTHECMRYFFYFVIFNLLFLSYLNSVPIVLSPNTLDIILSSLMTLWLLISLHYRFVERRHRLDNYRFYSVFLLYIVISFQYFLPPCVPGSTQYLSVVQAWDPHLHTTPFWQKRKA